MSDKSIFFLILTCSLYGAITSTVLILLKVPVAGPLYWGIWIGSGAFVGLVGGLVARYFQKRKKIA
jgi:hypothetical protein